MAVVRLAMCLHALIFSFVNAQEFAIGVYAPVTSRSQLYMALTAIFDLDLRKNFEPALVTRFGPPIIDIATESGVPLQSGLQSIRPRIGTSNSQPDIGLGTAVDFMLGLDGESPVSALVGGVFSSIAMPIASFSAVQQVPQIAYGATSPALSNKDTYPYFMRTVPPDSIQGQAFWKWIVQFQVPLAVCIYAVEPYGQGLYLAIEEQAKLAGEAERLSGVPLRYMPTNFVVSEAKQALDVAKSLGSRFLFSSMNSQMFTLFGPVMFDEGFMQPGWQILGSEAATMYGTLTDADFPIGFQRWSPVSRGAKYTLFEDMWKLMNTNDVLSTTARARYGVDNMKVPIASATVPTIDDSDFTGMVLPKWSTFFFDALYTLTVACNRLLSQGNAIADIKGELLLTELRATTFTGISGAIGFNENGDRLAFYELLVNEPVTEGTTNPTNLVVGAVFDAITGELTVAGQDLYWMDGQRGAMPPAELTNCDPGFYKEPQSRQCKPCPLGFYCRGGTEPNRQCARGAFANETGMVNCTLCPFGSFAAEVGSSSCSACLSGFYSDELGREACKKCPKGTYMVNTGASVCTPCGLSQETEESGSQAATDCRCAEGMFMCNEVGCQMCPDGLYCAAGLDPPVQMAGFWTAVTGPNQCNFNVLRCRDTNECPDNPLGECAPGREGLACNNCREGYFPEEEGTCLPCSPADSLPAILSGIAAVIVLILLLSSVNADLNQQSLNLLTVAAVGSQMVMAVQALGSIRQLSITWVDPVRHIIDMTRLLTFDFDIIRISCVTGQDSPTLKFLGQLLACPAGFCLVMVAWGVARARGRKMSLDAVFNLNGTLLFALFITLTLAVLGPFQCISNPDGSSSMASNPGIICYTSSEHWVVVCLSIVGIICYPVTILGWATYTTVMYPSRITSGAGLQLVNRYRFLFQRFRPECYYYGLVLLFRNAFVALFPVAFVSMPEVQVVLMGALFVFGGALQVRSWPWRTPMANYADLVMTAFLQVVLLGAAPLLEIDKEQSTEMLGWLLLVAVLCPLLAGLGAVGFAIFRHFTPQAMFGIFLCHHKGGAGSLCRLIKLLVARHSSANVFLDSDQLEDLDLIFDTIRKTTKSVVTVQTPELLKRMWCAGEIVTAFKNKVTTVPLICDGFLTLTNEALDMIPDCWTAQQKQILANYGITMEDVKSAYVWLRDEKTPLYLSRFGSAEKREEVVIEMCKQCKISMKVFTSHHAPTGPSKAKARILITGSITDAEALATCEVFQIMVQEHLRTECALVRSQKEMVAYKPWAYYFVVLFSRGMLRDPRFAQILLKTGAGEAGEEQESSGRQLEIVTVSADTGFEFPSAEFYQELEVRGLGQEGLGPEVGLRLSKAYRSLLNVLALPLSPMGSEGLLMKQTSEISRRFRRYKDPAQAQALDSADDAELTGQGVDASVLAELNAEVEQTLQTVNAPKETAQHVPGPPLEQIVSTEL
ncbi:Grm8 [Symbiodinium necroappetens]|uniref:Grm8 protein n=1 Tax=Symbiodinium necroappetens TaxID=1628268 RepID=A0A812NGV1_9DINO|nr:Grm8 [Symbiodinium necroappetens]